VELLRHGGTDQINVGDGSEIVGGTLEEAEEKLAALKNQQPEAI